MTHWRIICVLTTLAAVLLVAGGCAGRQRYGMEQPAGIERPAEPLTEERGFADRVGEVGVVLLVVAVTVGSLLLPILLL